MHRLPINERDLVLYLVGQKAADSLISSETPEGTVHTADLFLIMKQNEDKQRLGMKPGINSTSQL